MILKVYHLKPKRVELFVNKYVKIMPKKEQNIFKLEVKPYQAKDH